MEAGRVTGRNERLTIVAQGAVPMTATLLMTIEDLEREGTPDDGRHELIEGVLVEMAPSSSGASRVGARCVTYLGQHVLPRGLGDVFGADGGFAPFPGRKTVRVPDAAVVRADHLPPPDQDGFYRLAPDLVIEVVSPSDRMIEVTDKAMMWLDAGVRFVWVVDPPSRSVTVYGADRVPRLFHETDELDGGEVLPEFRLPVAALFA